MSIRTSRIYVGSILFSVLVLSAGCRTREKILSLPQLSGKEFGVPTGTVADKLVQSKFPDAKIKYFNSVLDACMAVKGGKVDAAAYDEPILKNIAAKNPGLIVLPEMITIDNYGFAVRLSDGVLKKTIDSVIQRLKSTGEYALMLKRWLPESGAPGPMPFIPANGKNGILRFGTSAVTEPFSFIDGTHKIVGLDIEIASLVAQRLDMELNIVNMDFGAMIPALISKKVDFIGACITITNERAKSVLFTMPYYTGGIAALVAQ